MVIPDYVIAIVASSALGLAGYAVKQTFKVDDVVDDLKYIRGRLDNVYDFLLRKGPPSR